MNTLRVVLLVISWVLIVAIMLPFVRNDYWVFRILEYPRLQKFIISVLAFTSFLFFIDYKNSFSNITMVILALCIIYLGTKIWPYTIMSPKEVKGVAGNNKDHQVKIFTANVLLDNRNYDKMLAQVKSNQPDIVFLLETDTLWEKAMDVLISDFPHYLKEPLNNTYGMLLYSKLPIKEGAINYLVEKDVPSLEATLHMPSGQLVKIWGLHPKPPVPGQDERSTAKDKEIMKIALLAKQEQLPVFVMGDLSDVAWSYVTELFTETSGLLDPRKGRGFYSTFSANHWYMRFPLDYVFCSPHFGLIRMKRLEHNGSDHFAMVSHFEYKPALKKIQEKEAPKPDEVEEAKEKTSQPH